jgi:uncharacterized membrane protein
MSDLDLAPAPNAATYNWLKGSVVDVGFFGFIALTGLLLLVAAVGLYLWRTKNEGTLDERFLKLLESMSSRYDQTIDNISAGYKDLQNSTLKMLGERDRALIESFKVTAELQLAYRNAVEGTLLVRNKALEAENAALQFELATLKNNAGAA